MNTSTDMSTGRPKPPLRMMAPSGAPIKKKMMHDKASVIFATHSILCWRMSRSPSSVMSDLNSRSYLRDATRLSA